MYLHRDYAPIAAAAAAAVVLDEGKVVGVPLWARMTAVDAQCLLNIKIK